MTLFMTDPSPSPRPDEARRLAALQRYRLTDLLPSPDLEALARLAAHIAGTPISQINILDEHTQRTIVGTGGYVPTIRRDQALCEHSVNTGLAAHTPDAASDPRFAHNPFVTGERARVRLYASSPLVTADGQVVGTLCVADTEVRRLDTAQRSALDDLAVQVMSVLELRRRAHELSRVVGELDHLAGHDWLTGLANRRRFTEQLDRMVATAGDASRDLVLVADLDDFKEVNDRLGHPAGDEVLRIVADRLRAAVRPSDLVARLGGDEFGIICTNLPLGHQADLLDRIRRIVNATMSVDGATVATGLSLGWARPDGTSTAEDLARHADRHLYRDKFRNR